MENKAFCILPFVHTFLNTQGDVFPCCLSMSESNTIGYLKDNTLEELFNSTKMKQLRLDLANGVKRPDVCNTCYKSEDNGFVTSRQSLNKELSHMIEPALSSVHADGYIEPKLKSWDIRYSNLCNLKCRSCGDIYSTTWSKENEEHENIPYKEIKAYDGKDPLKDQYENVEKIYFAGGEPLIMPEHYVTITELIKKDRAKKVTLLYNTNITKLNYNKHQLMDYWKEFKKVNLGLSIDSFGDRANYIRHGSVKWNKIEENIRLLAEYSNQEDSNITYYFAPTISVFNIYTITDLHRYLFENNLMPSIEHIIFNMLYDPDELSLSILPKSIKTEIQNKIVKHIEWIKDNNGTQHSIGQFEGLLHYLNADSNERNINTFFSRTNELDFRRNESFPKTFPEYKDWWEEIASNTIRSINI